MSYKNLTDGFFGVRGIDMEIIMNREGDVNNDVERL